MDSNTSTQSLQTLQEIRGIMERSTRFLSLSGWSGVWAGGTALSGAATAWYMINQGIGSEQAFPIPLIVLGLCVLAIAVAGGFYFTHRKAKMQSLTVWTRASRQLALQLAFPLAVGGFFALSMLYYNQPQFVAPVCLVFYGLALINGSKHTLGDIKALGFLEVMLGCINLFVPWYGVLFFAIGFGILHIIYGILMWYKYERNPEDTEA